MKNMRSVLHGILGEDLTSGEVLRALRIKAGFSQEELQEITGIARSNISAIENGRMEVTVHYALIFGAALKMHPAEILFPNGRFEKTDELKKIEKKAETLAKKHAAG
ncbi:helix-turn-helix domain-containing protein [Bdellovibrio bacteriovorus]|uniref:helix-turn-helix domain-containing protein n=1 Tax=Bdellovibrio bacteriovorus TaxID=959 RepID=UPI0035A69DB5